MEPTRNWSGLGYICNNFYKALSELELFYDILYSIVYFLMLQVTEMIDLNILENFISGL